MPAPNLALDTPAALGRALRILRQRRGLAQLEVAERLGLHRSYLSQMENGEFSEQVKRLFDLLRALDAELVVTDRNGP